MNNILNLVFDNWDESGDPLPNLNHLNEKFNNNNMWLPRIIFRLHSNDLRVNRCKLNEVNTDQNYYYIISHVCNFETFWKNNGENTWEISKEVEDSIRYKNLKVIFLSEHEGYKNLKRTFYDLNNLILDKKLNPSNFYVINNNSLLNNAEELKNYGINVYKINFLLDSVSCALNTKLTNDDFINEKKFIFLCHNRRPKDHRISLLSHMQDLNLLDNDITDWSLTYGDYNNKKTNGINTYSFAKPKLSYFETDKDWFASEDAYDAWKHLELKTYQNSYINIVTESHFEIADVHITEKSFKPFYFGQIPIFLASHNHVAGMKLEYNLDFYDDLINHDYDNEQDDTKRLNMVIDEIKRLSKIKHEIKKYYIDNKQRVVNNHNFIKNYYHNNFTFQYFTYLANKPHYKGLV